MWSHRVVSTNKVSKDEYYVKWVNFGPEHCTWEPEANLKNAPECVAEYWKRMESKAVAAAQRQSTRGASKRRRV